MWKEKNKSNFIGGHDEGEKNIKNIKRVKI
jgi:hypothetical protein